MKLDPMALILKRVPNAIGTVTRVTQTTTVKNRPGRAFTGTDLSLVVSRKKAWRGVIGLRRLPRIGVGVGVPGGVGAGGRTGLRGRF